MELSDLLTDLQRQAYSSMYVTMKPLLRVAITTLEALLEESLHSRCLTIARIEELSKAQALM